MTSSNVSDKLANKSGFIKGQTDARRKLSHCVDSGVGDSAVSPPRAWAKSQTSSSQTSLTLFFSHS